MLVPVVTATACDNYPAEPPSNAVDGKVTTPSNAWNTESGVALPHWWRGQFGSAAVIVACTIARRNDISSRNVHDFLIEGSNDGTTWDTLSTQTDITWPTANEVKTFDFLSNTTAYLYARIYITANNGDSYTSIEEIAFYDSLPGTLSLSGGGILSLINETARSMAFEYGYENVGASGTSSPDASEYGYEDVSNAQVDEAYVEALTISDSAPRQVDEAYVEALTISVSAPRAVAEAYLEVLTFVSTGFLTGTGSLTVDGHPVLTSQGMSGIGITSLNFTRTVTRTTGLAPISVFSMGRVTPPTTTGLAPIEVASTSDAEWAFAFTTGLSPIDVATTSRAYLGADLVPYIGEDADLLIPVRLTGRLQPDLPAPVPPVDTDPIADPLVAPACVASVTSGGYLPAGTYRYAYAGWVGELGRVTAPSPYTTITTTTQNTVTLTYPIIAGADGYRVIRDDGSEIAYIDVLSSSSGASIISVDTGVPPGTYPADGSQNDPTNTPYPVGTPIIDDRDGHPQPAGSNAGQAPVITVNATATWSVAEVPLRRESLVFNRPTAFGRFHQPVNWLPASQVSEVWGKLHLVIDGKDVTYFRAHPTEMGAWSSNEPNGDAAATMFFPQISWFETPGVSDLSWLDGGNDVDIHLIRPDGSRKVLFEGLVVGYALEGQGAGMRVDILGCLYQADHTPYVQELYKRNRDIGEAIAYIMDGTVSRHFLPCNAPVTYIRTNTRGSGGPRLTQGVQDLLATAFTNGGPVAVSREDDGTVRYSNGMIFDPVHYAEHGMPTPYYFPDFYGPGRPKAATYGQISDVTVYTLNQWTITNLPGRRPFLHLKDRLTRQWTMAMGHPGLTLNLTDDFQQSVGMVYGSGAALDGGTWYNAKYPGIRVDDAPLFPLSVGAVFTAGGGAGGFDAMADELRTRGYSMVSGDTYALADVYHVRDAQMRAGITVDGIVGAQTWAGLFGIGGSTPSLAGAHIAPLAAVPWNVANLERPDGSIIGPNPKYDKSKLAIGRLVEYGEGVTIAMGMSYALGEIQPALDHAPMWVGSATLTMDPENGSRWEMKAGQNIYFKFLPPVPQKVHIDDGILLHMSQVTVTPGGDVNLELSYLGHDMTSLAAIRKRNKDNLDPARRGPGSQHRTSRITKDAIVPWDAEAGGGRIPLHNLQGGFWTIVRIPGGQIGSIVSTRYVCATSAWYNTLDTAFSSEAALPGAKEFCIAIFDCPITANFLWSLVGNPLVGERVWTTKAAQLEKAGLIQAYGASDQPAGHWPGDLTNEDPLTGKLFDGSAWEWESASPPYLWVAEFCTQSTRVAGQLRNAPLGS